MIVSVTLCCLVSGTIREGIPSGASDGEHGTVIFYFCACCVGVWLQIRLTFLGYRKKNW